MVSWVQDAGDDFGGSVGMNLEYDDEEIGLLRLAGEVLQKLAPVPQSGFEGEPTGIWPALVAAGWGDIGAAVAHGELSLAVAIDLFRKGGQQLFVEQYVTSGYLLSALSVHLPDPDARGGLRESLRAAPGVLLGDGRTQAIPVVSDDEVSGYCFGLANGGHVYRLIRAGERFVLQRWEGAEPVTRRLADLSLSVGSVTVDPAAGRWIGYELALTAEQLEQLQTQALIVHSAALIGCSERLLEITCAYTRERVQFGVPVGSFQAVKHGLADVYAALVVAWNATLSAVADGSDETLAPLIARQLSVDAALLAARAGAQFHGGIGFTAELNVHLFLKIILDGVQRCLAPDEVAAALGRRFAVTAC
jgi:hypothetical protein